MICIIYSLEFCPYVVQNQLPVVSHGNFSKFAKIQRSETKQAVRFNEGIDCYIEHPYQIRSTSDENPMRSDFKLFPLCVESRHRTVDEKGYQYTYFIISLVRCNHCFIWDKYECISSSPPCVHLTHPQSQWKCGLVNWLQPYQLCHLVNEDAPSWCCWIMLNMSLYLCVYM